MDAKKFIARSCAAAAAMLLMWAVILLLMGETSKIPLAIGGIVAGWYLRKAIDRMKEVARRDAG